VTLDARLATGSVTVTRTYIHLAIGSAFNLDALLEISTETVLERDGTDENGNATFSQVRKTKIKLHDKLAALEKLARYTGIYDKETKKSAGAIVDAISDIQSPMSKAPIRRDVS
jgi:hypothetical protein